MLSICDAPVTMYKTKPTYNTKRYKKFFFLVVLNKYLIYHMHRTQYFFSRDT